VVDLLGRLGPDDGAPPGTERAVVVGAYGNRLRGMGPHGTGSRIAEPGRSRRKGVSQHRECAWARKLHGIRV